MSVTGTSLQSIATDVLVGRNLVAVCAIRGETILCINERCATLLGYSDADLDAGVPLRDVVAAADWPKVEQSFRQTIANPGSSSAITFNAVRKDGSIVVLEMVAAVASRPEPKMLVAVLTDITEKARADTQLNYLAFNDALTGLPNRALLFDRMRQTIMASRRSGRGFALLACDLDDFKIVNDTFGHETGDAVLQIAAERLRSCCREVDTAARMGGDEFVVILPGVVEPSHAALVAGRVIVALAEPIDVGSERRSVGVSLGIAFYPQDGQTVDTLFRSADAAMYASKVAGGNCFSFADAQKLDIAASGRGFVAWSEAHDTGIGVADVQHRQLAALIGKLATDLAAGEDSQRVRASFGAIIAFAESHFAAEEALMDRYGIDDGAIHKQMHRTLLQDARSLATNLSESSMMLITSFLNEWLLRHIDSADKALARQLQEKGYVDTQG